MSIKVAVIDERELFRQGIDRMISEHSDLASVGSFENAGDALKGLAQGPADIVVIGPSRQDDLAGASALLASATAAHVLIVAARGAESELAAAMRAGARGVLHTDFSAADLHEAVRLITHGQTVMPSNVAAVLMAPPAEESSRADGLTGRELEVLRLIAVGMSNKEIAQGLALSEKTVKVHVSSILRKCCEPNRTAAALYALRMGLVAPPGATAPSAPKIPA